MQPPAEVTPDRDERSTLDLARAAAARRDWGAAHELLTAADGRGVLSASALELLAESARWLGREQDVVGLLERAHVAFTQERNRPAGARIALALVQAHFDHGRDAGVASWLQRAQDLLADQPEAPEHGQLANCRAQLCAMTGDRDGQREHARLALEIARRHGDRSTEALALIQLGHVAAAEGSPQDALTAVDHATSIAMSGEANVGAVGTVLCNAIWLFRCRGEWDRAHHWTESSTRWVDRQQIQYFPALCRVHRAEVLRVRGRLPQAERECLAAADVLARSIPRYQIFAHAELGEVRRRLGDFEGARAAFGKAMQLGWDPQPGLALLLLAIGEASAAHRAIERVFRSSPTTYLAEDRANLLHARVQVGLANGDRSAAAEAVAELEELARASDCAWDSASAAEARGRLEAAGGDLEAAIDHLTRARRLWSTMEAPFELAICGGELGAALASSGDHVHARLEYEAAREVFERLGATTERDRIDAHLAALGAASPLTPAPPEQLAAELRREGDYWTVRFAGRVLRIRHGRGVEYLARLLSRPGEPCWAIELVAAPGSRVDAGDHGPVLDRQARSEYCQRLRDLEDDLREARGRADAGRVEAVLEEMDALGRQLAAAVGFGGASRRSGSAVERARQSVTKAIRSTIQRLAVDHPELGDHLAACVQTGTACLFRPDRRAQVSWRVEA